MPNATPTPACVESVAGPRYSGPIGFGFGDSGQLPFLADLGLVGRDRRQHPGHQPPGWCCKVKSLPQGHEADAGRTLNCDDANGHIAGDDEAMQLWRREYEPGWDPKV